MGTNVDDSFGTAVDRPRVIEGRQADPDAVDEVTISESLAQQTGLEVGSGFTTVSVTPEQIARRRLRSKGPDAATSRVVGIVRRPGDLSDIAASGGVITLTPAFDRSYSKRIALFTLVRRVRVPGADVAHVSDVARQMFGKDEAFRLTDTGPENNGGQSAIDVLTAALWIFAIVAAGAGLFAIGIVISRETAQGRSAGADAAVDGADPMGSGSGSWAADSVDGVGRRRCRGRRRFRLVAALPVRCRATRRSRSRLARRLVCVRARRGRHRGLRDPRRVRGSSSCNACRRRPGPRPAHPFARRQLGASAPASDGVERPPHGARSRPRRARGARPICVLGRGGRRRRRDGRARVRGVAEQPGRHAASLRMDLGHQGPRTLRRRRIAAATRSTSIGNREPRASPTLRHSVTTASTSTDATPLYGGTHKFAVRSSRRSSPGARRSATTRSHSGSTQ